MRRLIEHPVDAPVSEGRRGRYRLLSIPGYLVEELPRLLDEALGLPDLTPVGG